MVIMQVGRITQASFDQKTFLGVIRHSKHVELCDFFFRQESKSSDRQRLLARPAIEVIRIDKHDVRNRNRPDMDYWLEHIETKSD